MLQHPKDGVLRKKKGLNEYLDLFFAYVRKKYYLCAKFGVMCMKIREVSAKIWVIVSLVLLMVACKPAPQQVRRLGEEKDYEKNLRLDYRENGTGLCRCRL